MDGGCLQGLSGWLALSGCAFLVCSSGRVRILDSFFPCGMIFVLEYVGSSKFVAWSRPALDPLSILPSPKLSRCLDRGLLCC